MADVPQNSIADKLAGISKLTSRALLRPRLCDTTGSLRYIAKALPLLHKQSQRFLDITILTVLHGIDRLQSMPMVWGADHHGIQFRHSIQITKVLEQARGRVLIRGYDHGLGGLQASFIHITDRRNANTGAS